MEVRFQVSPKEMSEMNTRQQREHFLIQNLMTPGEISLTYTHYDRMIVGGATPLGEAISLPHEEEMKANFFLERREMGIINVGGTGTVSADGASSFINGESVEINGGTYFV